MQLQGPAADRPAHPSHRSPGTALFPHWRHFGFVTDLGGDAVEVDEFHREHATVELAIKDLKEGAGLEHVPSGNFFANSAWLICAVLAHDLIRWASMLGEITQEEHLTSIIRPGAERTVLASA